MNDGTLGRTEAGDYAAVGGDDNVTVDQNGFACVTNRRAHVLLVDDHIVDNVAHKQAHVARAEDHGEYHVIEPEVGHDRAVACMLEAPRPSAEAGLPSSGAAKWRLPTSGGTLARVQLVHMAECPPLLLLTGVDVVDAQVREDGGAWGGRKRRLSGFYRGLAAEPQLLSASWLVRCHPLGLQIRRPEPTLTSRGGRCGELWSTKTALSTSCGARKHGQHAPVS